MITMENKTESLDYEFRKTLGGFKQFDIERRKALLTMDEQTIRAHYEKWCIPFPREGELFWEAVAKNVLALPDIPPAVRLEAVSVLDELNIKFEG